MKKKLTFIIASLTITALATLFFSCDVPLALGHILDIKGPVVEFTSPAPRTAVPDQFDIRGVVSDESPIDRILLKAFKNNVDFAKQWRYTKGKGWEVSENEGSSWTAYPAAQWNGSEKSASWLVTIDMVVDGIDREKMDGEYTFTVQAWDTGGFTDDNSFKTIVLIYDTDPPRVDVYNPYLYSRYSSYDSDTETFGVETDDKDGQELQYLRDKTDYREPALLGKFLTQEFQLQWQIEDNHDIASIELLFYEYKVDIDNIEETGVPKNYFYSYTGNNKPNGSVWVPNLSGAAGQYNQAIYDGGTIKTPVTTKTTIKVVSLCYDTAGQVNQEKVLGYLIFWPEAAEPWITFTEGMETLNYYEGKTYGSEDDFKEDSYMIYPGRSIKATAFQAQGVSRVEYSLYEYNYTDNTLKGPAMSLAYMASNDSFTGEFTDGTRTKVVQKNAERPNGGFSTIFPWDFTPPPRSENYAVKATAYDFNGNESTVYDAVFRVQDITFPDFPESPKPVASEPLFKAIENNKITISGIVSDATSVESLYMVWINPESRGYAAMSQLSYFRDAKYAGWVNAKNAYEGGTLSDGGFIPENEWNDGFPNKVWKIPVTHIGEDYETFRQLYSYSQVIDITTDLNIGGASPRDRPLTSQVFLLRAENPDTKCTIITYAPQGDTIYPTIKIDEVRVSRNGWENDIICEPGEYKQVPQFLDGDRIVVSGSWTEDSTAILPIQTYLPPNAAVVADSKMGMEFEINRTKVPGTLSPASGNATSGTFSIDITVTESGGVLNLASMKDTLTVNAFIRDIGGNPAEVGNSWLIESDTLKFLRISSLNEDRAYRHPEPIEIFIEFNKPVKLKTGRRYDPILILNTGGRAYYKEDQTNENTRQFFTYTVGAGDNTSRLNVTGISIDDGITEMPVNEASWQDADYPFVWEHTPMSESKEEIRLTRTATHNGAVPTGGYPFYARAVPVTTNQGENDYMFTLGGGKRIEIDNLAPVISSFSVSPVGRHRVGAEIFITANFNKNVNITDVPYLVLGTTGGEGGNGQTAHATADDVTVNNNKITFKYTVLASDDTHNTELLVTNYIGTIKDIPGTTMAADAVSGMIEAHRTLTGVYLDNESPAEPTIYVYNTALPIGGAVALGNTSIGNLSLGKLYHNNMSVRITSTGTTGPENYRRLEYTLDGTNWTTANAAVNNDIALSNNGPYTIRARQTDQAGNVSSEAKTVTLNLDMGALVTSINSFTPNGIYTYNSARTTDRIEIQVNFRKALTFNAGSIQNITLNAVTASGGSTYVTVPLTIPSSPAAGTEASQLTFTYNVANGHNTNGVKLDVTGLSLTAAADEGVSVPTAFLNVMPDLADRLQTLKQIYIQTGSLTVTSNPAFNNNQLSGTAGTAGIQTDGSYNTAIVVGFNNAISKNTGNITITQVEANYRIPAVLTEAQYNKYRNVPGFDTYYTRGTNGYIGNDTIADGTPDTSTKYVLVYNFNPASPTAGDQAEFAAAFRNAEKITLSVNSSAVRVSGSNLYIDLAGANALQVPGAQYDIKIDAGFVQDSLSNRSPEITNTPSAISGVAKPFIRVFKKQDTIAVLTAATNQTRFEATQPLYTTARMDTRTPGANIYYISSTIAGEVTTVPAFPGNFGTEGPSDNSTNPARPADPRVMATGRGTYNAEVEIGGNNTSTTLANVQGLRWHVRARATTGNGAVNSDINTWSTESEEMAYRTVLTYAVTDMNNTAPGQNFGTDGKHIWIRGGNAIEVSTIPGFPLTWEDNFDTLRTDKKRAGIRLLSVVSNGNNLNTSTWRWVTWEINVDTYFDIILGNDPNDANGTNGTNVANIVTQYGPRQWAMQRAGWTSYKVQYRMFPGKHRYLVITNAGNWERKGTMNFSATWMARPAMTEVTWTP